MVMWKDEALLKVGRHSEWWVETRVFEEGKKAWDCFFIYAICEDHIRKAQFERLCSLLPTDASTWVMVGEFNDILIKEEKRGALRDQKWNRREGEANIKSHLDRVLCSPQWDLDNNGATCYHLAMVGADHCPIFLDINVQTDKVKRLFVFDNRWLQKDGCEDVVRRAWSMKVTGSYWFQVREKIKNVRMALIEWCKLHKFNSRLRIDDIQAKIKQMFEHEHCDQDGLHALERELDVAGGDEEAYWNIRSKEKQLKHGDKNTKFFHASVMIRQKCNMLMGMEEKMGSGRLVTEEMNQRLTRVVTSDELKRVVFEMPPDKSLVPKGMRVLEEEGRELMNIIGAYELASGKKINVGKSSVCFEPKVQVGVQQKLTDILGMGEVQDQGKYLGLPSHIELTKKKFSGF
ncbi:hypothetical protein LIER_40288 [Lithospermum erythrorhizon]|uniref:Uncharacterized protein n=1 Tax=Lithospermum erythrorhizon TaxID=34254 RepID=A0AAV3QXZ8_LITER